MNSTLEQYLLAIQGTIVSLVLFIVSYRQTIGARKERARAANAALERILLRRMVQDGYKPTPEEFALLREGLTRQYRVKTGEVADFDETVATLYTRVADSDFIPADRRELLLSTLVETLAVPPAVLPVSRAPESQGGQRTFIGLLAIVASVAGSLLGALPFLGSVTSLLLPEVLGAFGLSLGAISALIIGRRVRDRSEIAQHSRASKTSREFEDAVRDALNRRHIPFDWNRGRASYDYRFAVSQGTVLLEAKFWRPWLPSAVFHQLSTALASAVRNEGASEAWVVVPDDTRIPTLPTPAEVRFLTFSQFVKMLDEAEGSSGMVAPAS